MMQKLQAELEKISAATIQQLQKQALPELKAKKAAEKEAKRRAKTP